MDLTQEQKTLLLSVVFSAHLRAVEFRTQAPSSELANLYAHEVISLMNLAIKINAIQPKQETL